MSEQNAADLVIILITGSGNPKVPYSRPPRPQRPIRCVHHSLSKDRTCQKEAP